MYDSWICCQLQNLAHPRLYKHSSKLVIQFLRSFGNWIYLIHLEFILVCSRESSALSVRVLQETIQLSQYYLEKIPSLFTISSFKFIANFCRWMGKLEDFVFSFNQDSISQPTLCSALYFSFIMLYIQYGYKVLRIGLIFVQIEIVHLTHLSFNIFQYVIKFFNHFKIHIDNKMNTCVLTMHLKALLNLFIPYICNVYICLSLF